MPIPSLEENLNVHQSLPDQPTLEAEELKKKFDEAPNTIKDFINNTLIPYLQGNIPIKQSDGTYTINEKIKAQGGIEGNVKGNLEGNANSADSATNAR